VLAAYDIDGVRRAALYTAPAIAAVIAIGQQVVSGSGLEFVNSLLSGVSPLLGGK
jgi:hypothetical protein